MCRVAFGFGETTSAGSGQAAAGKALRASDQLGEAEVSVDRWLACGRKEGVASSL